MKAMFDNYSNSGDRKRRMFAASLLAGMIGLCAVGNPARASTPDDKQYNVIVYIAAGTLSSTANTILTVPTGKLLVITSVSYYRLSGAANSIGQLFIGTTSGGTVGYTALPEDKADAALFPAATLATTLYADSGTSVIANVYTSVTTTNTESDYVTVTGYLLPQK